MPSELNWLTLHDQMGTGYMEHCLVQQCPASCCSPKVFVGDNQDVIGSTICNADELDFITKAGRCPLSISAEVIFQRGIRRACIRNCLSSSGCSFGPHRPLTCKIYPFALDATNPLHTSCPQALKIGNDKSTLETILKIRKMLGYTDNKAWRGNLKDTLRCGNC